MDSCNMLMLMLLICHAPRTCEGRRCIKIQNLLFDLTLARAVQTSFAEKKEREEMSGSSHSRKVIVMAWMLLPLHHGTGNANFEDFQAWQQHGMSWRELKQHEEHLRQSAREAPRSTSLEEKDA